MQVGLVGPAGSLKVKKIRGVPGRHMTWREILWWSMPHTDLTPEVFKWRLQNMPRMVDQLWRFFTMVTAGKLSGYPFIYGKLFLQYIPGRTNVFENLGLVSLRAFTDVAVNDIVDEFDEATDDLSLKILNFHGIGTGVAGADQTDTTLGTELTTEYTGDVRATGAQTQPSANIYQTLGTNTLDSGTPAVTEHGILSQAATGGGLLLDRHTFAAKNLVGADGDGLQSTYQMTVAANG